MTALDRERVARLLESCSQWPDPADASRAAMRALLALGLVEVEWSRGFPCHGPDEDEDPDRPYWGSCGEWVFVPDDWPDGPQPDADEDEDALDAWLAREVDFECRRCHRVHAVDRYPRTIRPFAGVVFQQDAARRWMADRLAALDPDVRPLRDGIGWRALLGHDEVAGVWIDRSQHARTTTRAFAAAQPTVYVTNEPRQWSARFRDDPGIILLSLADWVVDGDAALLDAAARTGTAPPVVMEPPVRQWARPRQVDWAAMAAAPLPPEATAFCAAPGTTWAEVKVWLVDGDTVRIVLPGRAPRSFTAAELGLTNARSRDRRRTKGWAILEALCEGHGTCSRHVGGIASYDAFKVQVSQLARALREFVGIDASPFHPTSRKDGVRAIFEAGPLPEPEVYVGEDRWGA